MILFLSEDNVIVVSVAGGVCILVVVVVVSKIISVGVVVFCFWKNTKDPARTATTTRVIMSKNVFVKPCLFI
ncbi:TPA: hypothetical protein DCQ85_04840 [Candidatus Magasanikbacteria bacterium]|nr:hypothetical protein [Candidatus Magasanikbacteria bacterium]